MSYDFSLFCWHLEPGKYFLLYNGGTNEQKNHTVECIPIQQYQRLKSKELSSTEQVQQSCSCYRVWGQQCHLGRSLCPSNTLIQNRILKRRPWNLVSTQIDSPKAIIPEWFFVLNYPGPWKVPGKLIARFPCKFVLDKLYGPLRMNPDVFESLINLLVLLATQSCHLLSTNTKPYHAVVVKFSEHIHVPQRLNFQLHFGGIISVSVVLPPSGYNVNNKIS